MEELTPKEYFDFIKEKLTTINDKGLQQIYNNCLSLVKKYQITGQTTAMRKLIFHMESIEKEREIVKIGINTFIYRDDIEEYIDNIANDTVKIIELRNYERDIPDEIVEVIRKTKDKFNEMYVLFTDYTGKVERQIEEKRREKDPILFGTFQDKESRTIIDRFYFLGDWVDEYCDLTLDKMVNEIHLKTNKDIRHTINTPINIKELKEQLSQLESKDGNDTFRMVNNKPKRESFFNKVRTFFSK